MTAALAIATITRDVRAQPSADPEIPKEDSRELAQQLSDPIAALLSVTFESDLEWGGGPAADGVRYTLTLRPIVPFALDDDWNLISRTNIAFVHQSDLVAMNARQTGLGNSSESLFLSPTWTSKRGIVLGIGAIVSLPATDDRLGVQAIALGPTAALLHEVGPVTYGVLFHQTWAFDGAGSELEVQPEVAWTFGPAGATVRVSADAIYDWSAAQWTIPVVAQIGRIFQIADRPVEGSIGPIVYVARTEDAPQYGVRVTVTVVPR